MLTLSKVHNYKRIPDTLEVELVDENHYIRLSDGYKSLFAQNGEVYSGEDSPPLKYSEIPNWFWNLARGCSVDGRKRVGLVLPEEKGQAQLRKEGVEEEKYECPEPECLASVPMSKKGIHIARHTKEKKRLAKKEIVNK